ncbi:hypothetical protein MRB53_037936 [Persea americana]|nr:hypothetical protein MRB53_037936 [Persea americana]
MRDAVANPAICLLQRVHSEELSDESPDARGVDAMLKPVKPTAPCPANNNNKPGLRQATNLLAIRFPA